MLARIEVSNKKEAKMIRRGLEHKEVRAFVKIMGTLSILPSDRARVRVMRFVSDRLDEGEGSDVDQ